jgi:hypothetical protein
LETVLSFIREYGKVGSIGQAEGKKVNRQARQFVFRYNGDESSEEVVEDFDAEIPIPENGDTIERHGKNWKVVYMIRQLASAGAIPVIRVYLSDKP